MKPTFLNRKVLAAVAAVFLVGAGAVLWLERDTLTRWYYVRGLTRATDSDREAWATRVASLGEGVQGDLFDVLAADDPAACKSARAALGAMAKQWGADDPRTVALALRAVREYDRLSPEGRRQVLTLAAEWFPDGGAKPAAPALVPACSRLVAEAAHASDADTQAAALELCACLNRHSQGTEALSASRDLVRGCLAAPTPQVRLRAIQLALAPGMDLLEQVAALLQDPAVEVRRAALLAVGPANDAVLEDTLLPCLHDPDKEVRDLCQAALRSRGRSDAHIKLGFLLTDPSPLVRLQVLDHLREARDLDHALWLRRLSYDSSPAVRVAAVRAMIAMESPALRQRAREMAQGDQSPAVRDVTQALLLESEGH